MGSVFEEANLAWGTVVVVCLSPLPPSTLGQGLFLKYWLGHSDWYNLKWGLGIFLKRTDSQHDIDYMCLVLDDDCSGIFKGKLFLWSDGIEKFQESENHLWPVGVWRYEASILYNYIPVCKKVLYWFFFKFCTSACWSLKHWPIEKLKLNGL